jgi:hypothetical protein
MSSNKDLSIALGKTFTQVIRWESPPFIYKPITAITQSAPVRITATAHGLVDSWRVTVESVKGMTQMNALGWQKATLIDPDTIEINEVNALDFKAYVSGGVLKYNTPIDLNGFTARMSIKDKIGGTEILALTTVNNRILLDNAAKTISLTISATDTALLTAKKGVYDLELVSGAGVVTGLLSGSVTFLAEVTT